MSISDVLFFVAYQVGIGFLPANIRVRLNFQAIPFGKEIISLHLFMHLKAALNFRLIFPVPSELLPLR